VLAKRLIAALEATTPILLSTFVCLYVSAQSRSSSEAFITSLPCTLVFPDVRVGTSQVVLEMAVAEEIFRAEGIGTLEYPLSSMRSYVLI